MSSPNDRINAALAKLQSLGLQNSKAQKNLERGQERIGRATEQINTTRAQLLPTNIRQNQSINGGNFNFTMSSCSGSSSSGGIDEWTQQFESNMARIEDRFQRIRLPVFSTSHSTNSNYSSKPINFSSSRSNNTTTNTASFGRAGGTSGMNFSHNSNGGGAHSYQHSYSNSPGLGDQANRIVHFGPLPNFISTFQNQHTHRSSFSHQSTRPAHASSASTGRSEFASTHYATNPSQSNSSGFTYLASNRQKSTKPPTSTSTSIGIPQSKPTHSQASTSKSQKSGSTTKYSAPPVPSLPPAVTFPASNFSNTNRPRSNSVAASSSHTSRPSNNNHIPPVPKIPTNLSSARVSKIQGKTPENSALHSGQESTGSSKSHFPVAHHKGAKTEVDNRGFGDNARTYVEGMLPKSQIASAATANNKQPSSSSKNTPSKIHSQAANSSHQEVSNKKSHFPIVHHKGAKTEVDNRGFGDNARTYIEGMVMKTKAAVSSSKKTSSTKATPSGAGSSSKKGTAASSNEKSHFPIAHHKGAKTEVDNRELGDNARTYVEGMVPKTGVYPEKAGSSKVSVASSQVSHFPIAHHKGAKTEVDNRGFGDNARTYVEGMAPGSVVSDKSTVRRN